MALLKWDNNYSVSIDVIDAHHKKIIELLNILHDAILQKTEHEIMEKILEDLTACVEQNFPEEEELLRTAGYPHLEEHMESHRILAEGVWALLARYQEGEDLTYDVMNFLTSWITEHIMQEDKRYESFLQKTSPQPLVSSAG